MRFLTLLALVGLSGTALLAAAPNINGKVSTVTSCTETQTVTSVSVSTTTVSPGPVVELAAYPETNCAVSASHQGQNPNFQLIQFTVATTTSGRLGQCVSLGQQYSSFSWVVISGLTDPTSSCTLNFYTGSNTCFNDNGGYEELNVNNEQNVCQDIKNVKSIRIFC